MSVPRPIWHEDGLEAALARARAGRRPLLVWWTASWCPPCNELRLGVFDSARFAAAAGDFELLQIDGDAAGAQSQGETLGASFYPTCLLLDAHGRELLRLPAGLDAQAFCGLLGEHAAAGVPICERIRRVQDGGAGASDLAALAAHAWSLDAGRLQGAALQRLLQAALRQCPDALPRVRWSLIVHWLVAAAPLPPGSRAGWCAHVLHCLREEALDFADLYPLALRVGRIEGLAAGDAPALVRLQQALAARLAALEGDPRLGPTQQLTLLYGRVQLDRQRGDRALLAGVRRAVAQVRQAAASDDERLTALNMAAELLRACGDLDGAHVLLRDEAGRSLHAAYFMQALAGLCEERGDREGAIEWSRRAYQRTPPGATRFSRGVRHLHALLPGAAADGARFDRFLGQLLAELAAQPAPLAGNYRRYLADLFATLRQRGIPGQVTGDSPA